MTGSEPAMQKRVALFLMQKACGKSDEQNNHWVSPTCAAHLPTRNCSNAEKVDRDCQLPPQADLLPLSVMELARRERDAAGKWVGSRGPPR
jgi:hypothetical protein